MYDNFGNILLIKNDGSTNEALNIEHLPAGMYIIEISNERQIISKKIIKQ